MAKANISVEEIAREVEEKKRTEEAQALKNKRAKYKKFLLLESLSEKQASEFVEILAALGKTSANVAQDKNTLAQIQRIEEYLARTTMEELKKEYGDARSQFNKVSEAARRDPALLNGLGIRAAEAKMLTASRRIDGHHEERYKLAQLKGKVADLFEG